MSWEDEKKKREQMKGLMDSDPRIKRLIDVGVPYVETAIKLIEEMDTTAGEKVSGEQVVKSYLKLNNIKLRGKEWKTLFFLKKNKVSKKVSHNKLNKVGHKNLL